MKISLRKDPAFRLVFVLLLVVSAVLLFWECTRQPAAPSRVDWPAKPH